MTFRDVVHPPGRPLTAGPSIETRAPLIPSRRESLIVRGVEGERRTRAALRNAARLYSFTPAEVRLLGVLLEDRSLVKSAEQLRISLNTAKTQLQAVFHKTGTCGQPEWIRLLLDRLPDR